MVVEGDVMDVRLRRPDSQPEPALNAPANSNAPRSGTHAEPEAEVSTSAGTDMEMESVFAEFDFEKREREIPRDLFWTYPRIES